MNETLAFPAGARRRVWPLMVVGSREIAPQLRQVSLIGEDLDGFAFRPGQALVLTLPGDGESRRRYTIAAFDPDELRLDVEVPVAGDALAAQWTATVCIGDPILAERARD
jgi:NADPH-dependent ferric siderophore reductase